MAQLLLSNQEKYTPIRVQNGETEVLDSVPFHGDQLFEETACNTQWTYQDGVNPFDRLEGIETEFADWHAKYNLYMVITIHGQLFFLAAISQLKLEGWEVCNSPDLQIVLFTENVHLK